MADAVASAIDGERHLVVQAGTGTGKSLAYLVPAVLSGRRVVVATATKALQDQLAGKDLPFLAEHLGKPVEFAVLKGRANYACLQRVREVAAGDDQQALELGVGAVREELRELVAWAGRTDTGDRAELPREPSARAWAAVSVSARECPGAARCPMGEACFAEAARRRAAAADVVVVNTHLYGLHLASGGAVLADHDVVVIDEAHQLEEVISATAGLELGAGRFSALARTVRSILADDALVAEIDGAGSRLADSLGPHAGRRLPGAFPPDVGDALGLARSRLERAVAALGALADALDGRTDDAAARRTRAVKATASLIDDVDAALAVPATHVAWVEGPAHTPRLMVAPVDVADVLAGLWAERTAVLTSATLSPALPERLGLPPGGFDVLDTGSPFDYQANAILYCAAHLPDPRSPAYEAAAHEELAALIGAAGGRTLALFTSWRAMEAAAESVGPRLPYRVITQSELPKPALLDAFSADETSCLFATMGFWQGVDVPGPALSLVAIDRIPFPRPDEPLLQARRERAGAGAFRLVDLPRAATLLAQGAGRLIRSADDRGVVAVLDPRLAHATYRWELVRALPPMRRTRHRAEVEAFLRSLRDA
ncbi:MAG: ATP-dependent DNA helicase [Acidimicrobiales bacterium]|nr:ATP-dependent DNA helicase [Acidimicrobiales bacterium]